MIKFFVLYCIILSIPITIFSNFLTSNFPFEEPEIYGEELNLWATWYHLPLVDQVENGTGVPLRDIDGNSLGVELSHYNWCRSAMQGSVVVTLLDGTVKTFSFAGKTDQYVEDCSDVYGEGFTIGKNKFHPSTGPYGDGARYSVLPYRTIAVDSSNIPYGTVIYIPDAKGEIVTLPDGSDVAHDGYFLAGDTGSAILGWHIDVFLGVADSCPFSWIGGENTPFNAYIVTDPIITEMIIYAHETATEPVESEGTIKFLSPQNSYSVDNPVIFQTVTTGDISLVKYFAEDDYYLGESTDKDNFFVFNYTYNGVDRERVAIAKGYNEYGELIPFAIDSVTFTPTEGGDGFIYFSSFQNGENVTNPVIFEVETSENISYVKYFAEFFPIETIYNGENFHFEKRFYEIGERLIHVFGFNSDDIVIAYDSAIINVPEYQEVIESNISFISPSNGENLSNPVNFQILYSNNIVSVKFYENSQLIKESSTPPFSFEYSFETAGSHTIDVYGIDQNGVTAANSTVTFSTLEENEEYFLTILNPNNGDIFDNTDIEINIETSNNIKKIELFNDGINFKTFTTLPYNITYRFTEGVHTILAKGYNSDNELVKTSSISFSIKKEEETDPNINNSDNKTENGCSINLKNSNNRSISLLLLSLLIIALFRRYRYKKY